MLGGRAAAVQAAPSGHNALAWHGAARQQGCIPPYRMAAAAQQGEQLAPPDSPRPVIRPRRRVVDAAAPPPSRSQGAQHVGEDGGSGRASDALQERQPQASSSGQVETSSSKRGAARARRSESSGDSNADATDSPQQASTAQGAGDGEQAQEGQAQGQRQPLQPRSSKRSSGTRTAGATAGAAGGSTLGAVQQQQQQRRQTGRRQGVELQEDDPMYQPALTDKDLDADPPGHKSGYLAVIGRPNAGKSTLINALVGQKLSIVTHKPQTTRHRIMGIMSGADHQVILFDTPGIIDKKRTKLEERMMAAVASSIQSAEAIIAVVDAVDNPKEALAMFQPGPDWTGPPMAVLLNKADLLQREELEELKSWYTTACRAEEVFTGCAKDNSGLEGLKTWAISRMPEGPTLYPKDMVSEQPERFFVAECIREQIFMQYQQEVPYCTQVVVSEFKEGKLRGRKDHIVAQVLVEKEGQKPILIGRDGAQIKALGSAARREIELFLGRPVYLELSVQVVPNWRDDKDALKQYGYFDALLI